MPPQDVDVLTELGPSRTVEACQEPTNQNNYSDYSYSFLNNRDPCAEDENI